MKLDEFPTDERVRLARSDWVTVFDPMGAATASSFTARDVDRHPPTTTAAPRAEDVARVEAFHARSPEGYASLDVFALVELDDGRYAGLSAWCDTTGWDCQSSVVWYVGTRENVLRYGLGDVERALLGLDGGES